ncbi:MAG: DNA-3-methyladenine glycosylase I [Bacteroidia bacterium]|nr:DNA-3-methyladenine glycosylase I [Bacteroidia bacterium]NNC85686.1 DNA-3-methyladenine glycosylase I [Bacteroidia bacterium]NNM16116.1 DNA-3-methyladenine glycosylase I [Bacteroidia bacterium]
MIKRCDWCLGNDLMIKYHDKEWGVPNHNDKKLFEYLLLDSFQAGLSWNTILQKRQNFKKAFDNFDAKKISKYNQKKVNSLLQDAGIIRNKLKVNSAITNAQLFLEVKAEHGTFDKYIWQFVDGEPIVNKWKNMIQMPATSKQSDAMSKELKKLGFKFVGSTICYAFMQASGMVNDHITSCYRRKELL